VDTILCCVCSGPVFDATDALCWMDPAGQTCIAHIECLVRLGEKDLGL
jgi:hypothetical protein